MIADKYLLSLIKVYQATGGKKRNAVDLAEVLGGEGWTPDEVEHIFDILIARGWIMKVSDETLHIYILPQGIEKAAMFKYCLNCERVYEEDMNFCTEDGDPLVSPLYNPEAETLKGFKL
jgi:hypothetical protein